MLLTCPPGSPSCSSPVENKRDLSNAIALNSAMFNGARLVGPALAGLTVAAFGEGICFLVNGLSFLAHHSGLVCHEDESEG